MGIGLGVQVSVVFFWRSGDIARGIITRLCKYHQKKCMGHCPINMVFNLVILICRPLRASHSLAMLDSTQDLRCYHMNQNGLHHIIRSSRRWTFTLLHPLQHIEENNARKKMKAEAKKKTKKHTTPGYSPAVTEPTTSLAVTGLSRGERTGSRVSRCLWSYIWMSRWAGSVEGYRYVLVIYQV